MTEKWEFVVKGGKHKTKSQMSKTEIKQIKENNLNGNKYTRDIDEQTDESMSPDLVKVPTKNKNKSRASQKSEGEGNLHQQISKLNSENIKLLHKDLSEKFPNQHTVVLMDLAVHLNLMLKPSEESLKTISFDNIDFPYGLLLNDTKSALRGVFTTLNNLQLGNFLKSAMIQIADDNEKGIKSVGLMMLVQVCLKMKPTALITNRKTIFDLMNMYREQTVKFKCLIWVLKQACLNFNVACQIWLIYLLPFISQRCHTETVLLFGEEMMNYSTDTGGNDSALLHTDFLPIIDLVFNQATESEASAKKSKRKQMNFQLVPAHLQRLGVIYHKIKDQIFTSKVTGSLKDYFGSLFYRLSQKNKNEDFNKELLDCLDHCLLACPESLKVLEHLHTGHPQQTKIFLDHFKSGKSTAAAVVMKQKPYKALIDKIHSSSLATESGPSPVAAKSYQQQKRGGSSKSSGSCSCVWTIVKVVTYSVLMALLAAVVLHYQYPEQYRTLDKAVRPWIDEAVVRTRPLVLQGQAAATKARTEALRLWSLARPYVVVAAAKVEETGRYVYGKVEEVAPEMLDRVGRGYLAMEAWLVAKVEDGRLWLAGTEYEAAVQSLSAKVASLGAQVHLGCQWAVSYLRSAAGY